MFIFNISLLKFEKGNFVLDIASNDVILLKSYKLPGVNYVDIDPTIFRFKKFYVFNYKKSYKLDKIVKKC